MGMAESPVNSRPGEENMRPIFDAAFKEHGLPRIVAGKPQQNGRQQRVHRMLNQETPPPAAGLPAQQQRFDAFRAVYNTERRRRRRDRRRPLRCTGLRRGPIGIQLAMTDCARSSF
jgi:hypothetical protein